MAKKLKIAKVQPIEITVMEESSIKYLLWKNAEHLKDAFNLQPVAEGDYLYSLLPKTDLEKSSLVTKLQESGFSGELPKELELKKAPQIKVVEKEIVKEVVDLEVVKPDIFKNAKATKTSTKKDKKSDREEEFLGEELDELAAFKVLEQMLENESEPLYNRIKNKVIGIFQNKMAEGLKRPDSFVGTGKISSASCELRKRGSNLSISEDVANLLKEKKIPVEEKVTVEECYVINPMLSQDVLQKLSDVITKHPDLKKEEIIQKQEKQSSYVLAESTLDVLAKTGDLELITGLLEKLATFSVGKFKLNDHDIKKGSSQVKKMAIQILTEIGVFEKDDKVGKK